MARMGLGACCPPSSPLMLLTEGPRQWACRSQESLAPAGPVCPSCTPLSGHYALLSLSLFISKGKVIIPTSWGWMSFKYMKC